MGDLGKAGVGGFGVGSVSLCRSAAAACLALVMSRAILKHPTILPAGIPQR